MRRSCAAIELRRVDGAPQYFVTHVNERNHVTLDCCCARPVPRHLHSLTRCAATVAAELRGTEFDTLLALRPRRCFIVLHSCRTLCENIGARLAAPLTL